MPLLQQYRAARTHQGHCGDEQGCQEFFQCLPPFKHNLTAGRACGTLPGELQGSMPMFRSLSDLRDDTLGATAVEYGMILALVVLVVIIAIDGLATETVSMWDDVSSKSSKAMSNS